MDDSNPSPSVERRGAGANDDANEPLSPEFLAVLVMCGAEIRSGDLSGVDASNAEFVIDRRRPERRRREMP